MRAILREIEDAEAAAVASTRELHGTLHFLATPVLATHLLAPRIGRWRARYPGVALDVVADLFPQNRVEAFDVTFLLLEDSVDLNVVALQSASFDVLYCAALESAGIAVLSTALAAPQLDSGALMQLLPEWIFGRFTIYVALPSRKLLPARTRALLDFLGAAPAPR